MIFLRVLSRGKPAPTAGDSRIKRNFKRLSRGRTTGGPSSERTLAESRRSKTGATRYPLLLLASAAPVRLDLSLVLIPHLWHLLIIALRLLSLLRAGDLRLHTLIDLFSGLFAQRAAPRYLGRKGLVFVGIGIGMGGGAVPAEMIFASRSASVSVRP
jgi:hypothetical protein